MNPPGGLESTRPCIPDTKHVYGSTENIKLFRYLQKKYIGLREVGTSANLIQEVVQPDYLYAAFDKHLIINSVVFFYLAKKQDRHPSDWQWETG